MDNVWGAARLETEVEDGGIKRGRIEPRFCLSDREMYALLDSMLHFAMISADKESASIPHSACFNSVILS